MCMPLTTKEKICSMSKLVSVIASSLCMSLTILYIDWGQNSFLLIALLTLFQESMQGIILPILFINNLPNLKNYIWKKIFKTATAFKNGLSTICITVIGYLPKRENQIDVMA